MKLLTIILAFLAVLAAVSTVEASIVPVNPISTTYPLPPIPLATSYQVVSRHVNRIAVPHVHPHLGYPHYVGTWSGYPYNYRFDYGYGYPYNHVHNYGLGYPYAYGATVW